MTSEDNLDRQMLAGDLQEIAQQLTSAANRIKGMVKQLENGADPSFIAQGALGEVINIAPSAGLTRLIKNQND